MRQPWVRRFVPAVPAALTAAAAGLGFRRVFGWQHVVGPLVVGVILGGAAGVFGRLGFGPAAEPAELSPRQEVRPVADRYLVGGAAIVVAIVIATVATALAFVTPNAGGLGPAISDGLRSLVQGWSRILTTGLPVPPTVQCLPVVAATAALSTGVAVMAATRPRPSVTALFPSGLVLILILVLGVGGPGSLVEVAGPPVVVAVAYLLVISRPGTDGEAWLPPSRALAAGVTGAVVLVVTLTTGSNLPLATVRAPVNLRSSLTPPVDLGDTPNPLDIVPVLNTTESAQVMFTADVDQAWLQQPADWQLVTLDVYDGNGWTTDAKATRVGNVVGGAAGIVSSALGPESHQTVRIQNLTGPFVPTTGQLTGVAPADLAFDASTGVLVATPSVERGVFSLSDRAVDASVTELDQAGTGIARTQLSVTAVPSCVPSSLLNLAKQAVPSSLIRPDQEAAELQLVFSGPYSGFTLDTEAAPGSNCGRLAQFLKTKQGTAEQFAAAFVLMARSLGLPARLAVGFGPGQIDAATRTTTVRGADATVWPEIDFAHIGWQAFDPLPSTVSRAAPSGPASGASTPTTRPLGINQVVSTVAGQGAATTGPLGASSSIPSQRSAHASASWWLLLIPAVLLLIGVPWAGFRTWRRRQRRERRKRTNDPVQSVLGAWAEIGDTVALYRVDSSSLTPAELTEAIGSVCPLAGTAVAGLADLVDRAVYGGLTGPREVDAAWQVSDNTVAALRSGLPMGLRWRYLLLGPPPADLNPSTNVLSYPVPDDPSVPLRTHTGSA